MTVSNTSSESVRRELVDAVRLDLIGPDNAHAFANELLPEPPSRWYLTGFLVPAGAPLEQRTDATAVEEIDSGSDVGGTDDATTPDRPAARRGPLPSSIGLTALVPAQVQQIHVCCAWGDYALEGGEEAGSEDHPAEGGSPGEGENQGPAAPRTKWRRTPREAGLDLSLGQPGTTRHDVPESDGLKLMLLVRPISALATANGRLPDGTRSVSVFLVNERPDNKDQPDPTYAFQAGIKLVSLEPFVPRPDLRGTDDSLLAGEWDERLNDLHYRDVFEHAVGHGVSARGGVGDDGACHVVETAWIPQAEVERVAPAAIKGAELRMEELGALTDAGEAKARLLPLVTEYCTWIQKWREGLQELTGRRLETAESLLVEAEWAANRIEEGIGLLETPQVLDAFCIANRAMARAYRQREGVQRGKQPGDVDAPAWRPFQLGFLLMTMRGIVEPSHADREVVDLLFFPTGGGKTEAYLGLAAFTLVFRRLHNQHPRYAGLSVLMRYTLRLLTLDQLGRAAALVCALELEREKRADLGAWPFEIGLWVGSAATPNRMGHRGYDGPGKDDTAYIKTRRYKQDSKRHPAPIPLENCPWCGEVFRPDSFTLVPNEVRPLDLRVHCANPRCDFRGDRPLPIVTVDEPIYRRLPAFLIATVDKFAALPWIGETGALFGLVDRCDADGFYGPCQPGKGHPLEGHLPPPDLIIQDELHLISGPLGTIAGVYEAAIDALATREVDGKPVRPKVIASTATVRRADTQVRALFERQRVAVFPPPGPNRRDSFFAETQPADETPARLYVGVAAPGRSLKVVFLRTNLALLSAAQVAYEREGGARNRSNPADPYMTLLGYFNSLRELGGSRRIVEDEVVSRLERYERRRRLEPEDLLFTSRRAEYEPVELTSRVPTNQVATAKRRLALPYREKQHVDIALATNMISVGLDIIRLGLMVVLGQPKMSAEYIQATSRVGRDPQRPGLVVTLLNVHKPRDRSHYERFGAWHASFYRAVEATSVTPFAPRALDRALPAAIVGMCRHGVAAMTPPQGAEQVLLLRDSLRPYALRLAERAVNHAELPDPEAAQRIRDQVLHTAEALLNDWLEIAQEFRDKNIRLQYQQEVLGGGQRLLYDLLDPDLRDLPPIRRRFRAGRSMRDVEPSVDLVVKPLNEWGNRT